jgi:hypothetical protein
MKTLSLRSLRRSIVIFTILLFCAGMVQAGVPNLVGTWYGEYDIVTPDGVKKSSVTFVIRKQEGPLLVASRTWKRKDASVGKHRGNAVSTATDQLLGVIDHDNKSVFFVKSGPGPESTGLFRGQVSGNTLKLIFLQSGELARAGKFVLTRK